MYCHINSMHKDASVLLFQVLFGLAVVHMLCDCVQVQFQVGLAVDGGGMRAVNIVSRHAFLRGNVESIKGQGQVDTRMKGEVHIL